MAVAEIAACPWRRRSIIAMGASMTGALIHGMPGSEMRKLLTQRTSGYRRNTCWKVSRIAEYKHADDEQLQRRALLKFTSSRIF